MSQHGPVVLISAEGSAEGPASALQAFPLVVTRWSEAAGSIARSQPLAVVVTAPDDNKPALERLSAQIAARIPYTPLIAIDPKMLLPAGAMPFSSGGGTERLRSRLSAALRVRELHATTLRRLDGITTVRMPDSDPIAEATILLIGRGSTYPALSVALGERIAVIGALSIEAAAKHLNLRDLDGVVIGDGLSARVVEAFLTVLAEDSRFRHLPIVATTEGVHAPDDLPNLEVLIGEPNVVAINALSLFRQQALEARLRRTLASIDAGGMMDPRCGLLTSTVFLREFADAVAERLSSGGALSAVRFSFAPKQNRALTDGARILARLMRQSDFGAVVDDQSIIVAFPGSDMRLALATSRRLASVMRHTIHSKRSTRVEPEVTVTTLLQSDSADTVLGRLFQIARRAAS